MVNLHAHPVVPEYPKGFFIGFVTADVEQPVVRLDCPQRSPAGRESDIFETAVNLWRAQRIAFVANCSSFPSDPLSANLFNPDNPQL
jgi:hypothetical protein